MKKTARRKHRSIKRSSGSSVGTYVVIFLIVIFLILLAKVAVRAFRKPFVLGVSSSQLLAKGDDSGGEKSGGDDHGGSSGGGGSSSGGGGSSSGGGSNNSGGGSGSSSKSDDNKGSSQASVSDDTTVDCVGPDSKHFQTNFKSCADLNKAFNKPNFNFTPLTTQLQQQVQQAVNQEVEDSSKKLQVQIQAREQEIQKEVKTGGVQQNVQVKSENGKTQVNISQQGTTLEIKTENGKTEIHAKKADGTEIQLSSDDAVKKINEVLKEREIEVDETPDKEFVVKKGEVEAEAKVPVSVNPVTKELSITTPAGLKTVTVLPDKAVANLIANKEITNVTQQSTNFGANSSKRIALTELNNEPVFQVDGVLNKKLLGVVPLSFAKTSFVSGTTGNVVKTDEALINKILEAFSF